VSEHHFEVGISPVLSSEFFHICKVLFQSSEPVFDSHQVRRIRASALEAIEKLVCSTIRRKEGPYLALDLRIAGAGLTNESFPIIAVALGSGVEDAIDLLPSRWIQEIPRLSRSRVRAYVALSRVFHR
jgi:hypothetical protein